MTALNNTSFASMLKELYPEGRPEHVATRKRPLLRMVKKMDGFEGKSVRWPVTYEFPMGRSATFAKAQANAKPSKIIDWTVPVKTDFGIVEVDALTIRSSRSNRGAFVKARESEVDGILRNLGRSASISL